MNSCGEQSLIEKTLEAHVRKDLNHKQEKTNVKLGKIYFG